MGLKQSIVVVNEYTIKNKKGGSRGGTPGDYVTRYMARTGATEDLTPVRLEDTDAYITRYMARKEASETLNSVSDIKKGMKAAQGYGGLAFGYGDISLSDEKLRQASRDIQRNFDKGKTVMKTVLSFDEEYLRETGIITPDFHLTKRGDYRGNIDQMKLRRAIMHGLDRLSKQYDDLKYVGVIQVDTAHLHCHLAMVDRGKGNITPNGTQRGKLSARAKDIIRRGIDMSLDEQQQMHMMASQVGYDKINAVGYIKKYTHRVMSEHGLPQFLLMCLPEDKRLWRADTNRKEMQKPNAIVREYVTQMLRQPNSGYISALQRIDKYAKSRQVKDDLSGREYRTLVKNGKERLIKDCMNGVYQVLSKIPDSDKTVWTPMMSAMSMSYDEMSAEQDDPMIEFGFKLRSYSNRLQYHKKEVNKYHEAVKQYEQTQNPSEDSKPLYEFFKFEEDYNAKLMCKYQHFLSFLPPTGEYEDDFDSLMQYKDRIDRMYQMSNDKSMKHMLSTNAEMYGRQTYGLHGGQYVVIGPQVLDIRLSAMRDRYAEMKDDFKFKLSTYGMTLKDDNVSTEKPYAFDDVKALDIHHLSYDWTYDFQVSKPNVEEFVEYADKRYKLYQAARQYLVDSGQEASVDMFAVKDIELMHDTADKMRVNTVLISAANNGGRRPMQKTVSLDDDYNADMKLAIQATVESTMQFGDNDI